MASADLIAARLELGAEWLDARDAARAIGCTSVHLTNNIGPLLTRKSRSLRGRGARNVGYAYATHDVKRVKAIMKALGCPAFRAAQLLQSIRRLAHLGLLAEMEKQLELEPTKAKRRRKQ